MRYDVDSWRENVRGFFDLTVLGDPKGFSAEASFVPHDRLIFSWARFSPQRFDREPAIKAPEFDHDFLLFEHYLSGAGHGVSVEMPTRVDTRTLHLVDVSRSFRTMTTAVETCGLWIPHDAVGYEPGRYPPYASCLLTSARGRLLEHAFRMLSAALLSGQAGEADDLAGAFLALVRTLLLGQHGIPPEEETANGTARLLHGYVARNLDAEDLGVDRLCHEFGVSRATLYRLFSEQGGVRSYIREQRLQRCLAQLLNAEARRGQVRRIAERWGFEDAGNFNRCFRNRFGFPPSECLGVRSHQRAPPALGPSANVSNWLRHSRPALLDEPSGRPEPFKPPGAGGRATDGTLGRSTHAERGLYAYSGAIRSGVPISSGQ